MKVLVLGCGNMAGAMLRSWLPFLQHTGPEFWILRMAKGQQQKLKAYSRQLHLVSCFAELQATEQQFDLIILGMKPQVIREQMENCLCLDRNNLWLTMAAGLPLSWYRERKAGLRILRIMPNLGAQVAQSASLLYKEPDLVLSLAEQGLIEQLVKSIGTAVWCHTESQLDNATPITGSGPAYFYLLTEALQAELEKQGFAAQEAAGLAMTTFLGAAAYLSDMQGESMQVDLVARLRQAVTSKAGVTEAALSVLSPPLMAGFAQAVGRGIQRNRELQCG